VLEGCGATVVAVATAAEALDHLAGPDHVDAVVSDIGMPGEDGYHLIRRLRARPDPEVRGVPTIALTAYARPEDRDRALAAGYDHHLAKPLDPARVAHVIADLLGRA
jgi:CheY-like chemotaxis protein